MARTGSNLSEIQSSSDSQRDSKDPSIASIEWLTVGLLGAVWSALLLGTWIIGSREIWFALPLLAPLVTLHSSLVHEAIHGHPTRNPLVNECLLTINPGLFIPYGAFRDSHRAHHETDELTDPELDTESNFLTTAKWVSMGAICKRLRLVNATLVGRLVTGPLYTLSTFVRIEARRLIDNEGRTRLGWASHIAGCSVVVYWLAGVCGISMVSYVLLVAYPAMSLLTLRTYAEHNWAKRPSHRTAIVESSWPLSLLFLNNNLHAVHHDYPQVPWYQLPRVYRQEKSRFDDRDNFFKGYREIFRQFAFKAYAPVVHPSPDQ